MTTPTEIKRLEKIVKIIKENSPISNVQIVLKSQLSISYFDKLRPFVIELYSDIIQWRKDEKLWYYIKSGDKK